ncbi:MAG: NADH-quinone oxidoreductase subunit NuoF [Planctomycetota bacterium]|nr:MAG: NADH-quinone oxidoreductase subunit NuoF [Planctomycetota bacterium]
MAEKSEYCEHILLSRVDLENSTSIDVYLKSGGYETLKKTVSGRQPQEIVDVVRESGLRGRGGAGFPAGVKWGFLPKDSKLPIYLIGNADEGEPGTFKDRVLIEKDPHQLIEGMAITAFAIKCHTAYIYIRGEFAKGAKILNKAIDEAYEKGFLGDKVCGTDFKFDIYVHRGAGAYVCGEETALIESIEGKKGQPRLKPPFPANVGVFQGPTIVNNVETLSSVPWIVKNGAEAYRKYGTEKSAGTKLFCVSGHVEKPGVYELPLGFPLMQLVNEVCGGVKDGKKLKGVIPGGSSTPILTPEECENVNLDYESLMEAGSMLGSGAVIVLDETVDIVRVAARLGKFYSHESCGQCTPCREGSGYISGLLQRLNEGKGEEGDLELIESLCDNMAGKTVCPLADAMVMPVKGFLKKFRSEFEARIRKKAYQKADKG